MSDTLPHEEFHEVWWVYSPINGKSWAGLRLATFRKSVDGALVVIFHNEIAPDRIGIRIWDDVQNTELWYKVVQVPVPTLVEIMAAALKIEEPEI